jgi:hypothetical protein
MAIPALAPLERLDDDGEVVGMRMRGRRGWGGRGCRWGLGGCRALALRRLRRGGRSRLSWRR